MSNEYDVVVVGGGVAGALLAWRLARDIMNLRIVILDAGPEIVSNDINVAIDDRITRTGDYAVDDKRGPGAPYREVAVDGPEGRTFDAPAGSEWKNGSEYFVQDKATAFRSTYERALGGSTWHFLGNVPRFVPADFTMCTTHKRGVDWPITYDLLEPYYADAEDALGVAGEHAPWNGLHGGKRSRPFPMTEIWPSHSDLLVEQRIGDLAIEGTKVVVMRTPQARNSRPFDGRPACAGNSICVPICPIGAKYDASVHIRKAKELGVEIMPRTVARKLLMAKGRIDTIEAVQWDDASHPSRDVPPIRGRIVVLAGGAIESARLLLHSGIANSSGQVGLNLMDHANRFGWVRTRDPVFPFRGPPTTSGVDAFRDGKDRKDRAAFRLSVGNDGAGRNNAPEILAAKLIREQGLYGARLKERLRAEATHLLRVSSSTEILPSKENRVELDGSLDRFGMPRPKLTFKLDSYTQEGYTFADQVIGRILECVGSDTKPVFEAPDSWSGAGHIMGTTRMGHDPGASVVDPDCKSHDCDNLFLVGASVFPTSGTANPTLTVAALALRAAEHLKGVLGRGSS